MSEPYLREELERDKAMRVLVESPEREVAHGEIDNSESRSHQHRERKRVIRTSAEDAFSAVAKLAGFARSTLIDGDSGQANLGSCTLWAPQKVRDMSETLTDLDSTCPPVVIAETLCQFQHLTNAIGSQLRN